MKRWEAVIPVEDRQVYDKIRLRQEPTLAESCRSPVLLVIDVIEAFVGTAPVEPLAAVDEYPTSCGLPGWKAVPRIKEVLDACRAAGIPVVFSKGDVNDKVFCGDSTRRGDPAKVSAIHSTPIVAPLQPLPTEYVLHKPRASVFYGTPLTTYLNRLKADTLLVCGVSTSGCVQASVIDGYAHGYQMLIIEECCFDRSEFIHLVTLYNLNAKYGRVIDVEAALALVATKENTPTA